MSGFAQCGYTWGNFPTCHNILCLGSHGFDLPDILTISAISHKLGELTQHYSRFSGSEYTPQCVLISAEKERWSLSFETYDLNEGIVGLTAIVR